MNMDLDDLLAAAAKETPQPSADLLARIAADAAREQPRPAVPAKARWGWGRLLADLVGGGGGLASLTAAAVSGLWIGVAQPSAFSSVTEYLTGSAAMEVLPQDDGIWAGE